MQPNNTPNRGRFFILVIAFFVLMFGLILFLLLRNDGSYIDDYPQDGRISAYSNQANILEGQDLLQKLEGVSRFEKLSEDLFVFAKNQYEKYQVDEPVQIGFLIEEPAQLSDGGKITFKGRFGATENTISVSVALKKHGQITTSITDEATGNNIDPELPSNTPRKQYIGSLPIIEDTYAIDYSAAKDIFVINQYEEGLDIKKVTAEIANNIGVESLSKEDYRLIVPSWILGGIEE